MPQTAPTAITTLPAAPSTSDPDNFSTEADAFVAALPDMVSDTNAISTVNYNNAVDCYNNAVAAAASQVAAAASAASAAATAGVVLWVSGSTYATGVTVYSPVTYLTYRRTSTSPGSTVVDPSLDPTKWVLVGVSAFLTAGNSASVSMFNGGL